MRKCSKCGYECEDKWFCPECGETMVEVEELKENIDSTDRMVVNDVENVEKSEDVKINKYDNVKKSKLYKVMSVIILIWGILTVVGYIYHVIRYGFLIIDLFSYSVQFIGAFIPGKIGVSWAEKENAYQQIKTALIVFIVISIIVCAISLGYLLLMYGIPIVLYIIGAVLQMKNLKNAGFKPEKGVKEEKAEDSTKE